MNIEKVIAIKIALLIVQIFLLYYQIKADANWLCIPITTLCLVIVNLKPEE